VAKTLFDADVSEEARAIGDASEIVMEYFGKRLGSLLAQFLPLWLPTPANLRLHGAIRRLDQVVYRMIADRRRSPEDRGAPPSRMPGEKSAATQPFPTKPAPFEIQGVREADLIDLTPALRAQALDMIGRHDHGPLYTPPSEGGAIAMPGVAGGASWSGAVWDPETQMYYVTRRRSPHVLTLRSSMPFSGDRYVGDAQYLPGPQNLPLFKPPWGSLVAIDMSSGDHRWRSPVGSGHFTAVRNLGISERLGWPSRSFVLVTKTVLLLVQSGFQSNRRPAPFTPYRQVYDLNTQEPKLYAYDKASGRLLAEVVLPANASGAPMTYMAGGKQYVAFPIGGANITEELIALTLP
jgi:quinoprotein glucose dehydrogenase